ncbi:MAG: dihydroorotate dehydrogenase electron transfer subunit [Candidatus Fimenecus sp.]
MKFQELCEIKTIKKLIEDTVKMTIHSSNISKNIKPGMFLNILCGDNILRRPISVLSSDKLTGLVSFAFQIKGEGTRWLSNRKEGEYIDVLGPLGNPFEIDNNVHNIFVGGGIGVPPIIFAANSCKKNSSVILGFRNKERIILLDELNSENDIFILTDDGSFGEKGFVNIALEKELNKYENSTIYACGPDIMLKKVVETANKFNAKSYVSLESRMACGLGACLCCATKIKIGNEIEYKHICKDGPIFLGQEVVFDD